MTVGDEIFVKAINLIANPLCPGFGLLDATIDSQSVLESLGFVKAAMLSSGQDEEVIELGVNNRNPKLVDRGSNSRIFLKDNMES